MDSALQSSIRNFRKSVESDSDSDKPSSMQSFKKENVIMQTKKEKNISKEWIQEEPENDFDVKETKEESKQMKAEPMGVDNGDKFNGKKKKGKSIKKKKRNSDFMLEGNDGSSVTLIDDRPVEGHMLFWIISLCFLTSMDSTLVLTNLDPYLETLNGSRTDYWLAACLYYVAKCFSCAFLGWLMDWFSYRSILGLSAFLLVIGNLLYSQAPWMSASSAIPIIIFGRVLAGLGSSNTLLSNVHIIRSYSLERRINRISWLKGTEIFGMVLGPAIAAIFSTFDVSKSAMQISQYNAPSLMFACLFVFYIACILLYFVVLKNSAQGSFLDKLGRSIEEENEYENMLDQNNAAISFVEHRFATRESILLLFVYFTINMCMFCFSSAVLPVLNEKSWNVSSQYYVFILGFGVSVASYLMYLKLSLHEFGYKILTASLLIMAAGAIAFTRMGTDSIPSWQWIFASCLFVLPYIFCALTVSILYTALCGSRMDNLGSSMTWFFSVLSLAPVLGLFWGNSVYAIDGINLVSHTTAPVLIVVVLIVLLSQREGRDQAAQRPLLGGISSNNNYTSMDSYAV